MARHARWCAIAVAIGAMGRAAEAQFAVQVDGAVNAGYSETTQPVASPDPMPAPGDIRSSSTGALFTEIRPGLTLLNATPRFTWLLGGQFSGILNVSTTNSAIYTSQLHASIAATVTDKTTLSSMASVAQGSQSFLTSQRAADTGQPMIQARGNPDLVTTTATEILGWEAAPQWTLHQGLSEASVSPQDQLGAVNATLIGSLALDYNRPRDQFGLELRASVSRLQQLLLDMPQPAYTTYVNSVRGRWNHDLTRQWNWLVTAGVGQVFTNTGSRPIALLPIGNIIVRYTKGAKVLAVDFTQDIASNLLVGSVSATSVLTARGFVTLDDRKARILAFSTGAVHNEPIGLATAFASATTGNVVQADVGFTTMLTKNVLANVRYSIAYQFDQVGSIGPQLLQILSIGMTGRYTSGTMRTMPSLGQRVDGGDGTGFRVVDEPATDKPVIQEPQGDDSLRP